MMKAAVQRDGKTLTRPGFESLCGPHISIQAFSTSEHLWRPSLLEGRPSLVGWWRVLSGDNHQASCVLGCGRGPHDLLLALHR